MAVEVSIPQLGVAMQEGAIVEWLAADGAAVRAGDPLYLLETDKAQNEIEAPADGTLRIKVEADPDGMHPIGTVVAVIE